MDLALCMHPTYEAPSTLTKQRSKQASLVNSLAGSRSSTRKLPSYIEPSLPLPASSASSSSSSSSHSSKLSISIGNGSRNGSGTSSGNDVDDKLYKYSRFRQGGFRARILQKANDPRSGWIGAVLRTAIRAGILEARFWRLSFLALLALLLGCLLLLLRAYEVHIEIAFHSRSWIKRSIDPIPPLSGTCFNPEHLSLAGYNNTIASSPNKLLLNPGISMRFGLDCYKFSGALPSEEVQGQTLPEQTVYHLYWRADLAPLGERQVLLLKSILANVQGEAGSSVVLWTNEIESLSLHPSLLGLKAAVGDRFSIQLAHIPSLAAGTYMASSPLLTKGSSDKRAWLDGDLVRILVLYRHGGIWIDMDTIMLRSFRPLTEQEWVTQWDCYDKPYAPLNGAVMHFYKGSPYLCEMLYMMSTSPAPRPSTTDWGSLLYHQLHRRLLNEGKKPFTVLPYCLTDGRSCRIDNRLPDPFDKDNQYIDAKAATVPGEKGRVARELQTKVESVYSIHLHNQWEKSFPKDGWIDRLVVRPIENKWKRLEEKMQSDGH